MQISILSVGNELLIGQTIDTNSSWIGRELSLLGCQILYADTCGDNKSDIVSYASRLLEVSDLLVVTGGLGPTDDDLTKDALCTLFDDSLTYHQATLDHLEQLYMRRGRVLNQRSKLHALLPQKCLIIDNPVGSAPAMLWEKNGKYLISLPGVPSEMKSIVNTFLVPFISNIFSETGKSKQYFRTLRTAGIPESDLALALDGLIFQDNESLAYLPSTAGVKLRFGINTTQNQIAQSRINDFIEFVNSKIGNKLYSVADEELEECIYKLMKEKKQTLAIAESCTGGMLGSVLSSVSGSSVYFLGGVQVYSNFAKSQLLGVNPALLEQFGAVSSQCADELASNTQKLFNSTYAISITGIAGPGGGSEEKPVGTVWIGFSDGITTTSKLFNFSGDRENIRKLACHYAMRILLDNLLDLSA